MAGGCAREKVRAPRACARTTRPGVRLMAQLAPPAGVLDHAFGAGPPFTVGIEEEYMLLDPASFDLVPGAERILQAEAGGEFAAHVSPELFESLVEFHTPVCADV